MADFNQNQGHEIGWDDVITNDGAGQFILLAPGDYHFTVKGFERGRFPGSQKIPPCNKAVLTLEIDSPEGTCTMNYDLILWSSLEWKIAEFFRAIGQRKHGDTAKPNWNAVIGAQGMVKIKNREYTKKDGTVGQANDVDKFYDFGEKVPSQAQAAPQQSWNAQPQAQAPQQNGWQSGKF